MRRSALAAALAIVLSGCLQPTGPAGGAWGFVEEIDARDGRPRVIASNGIPDLDVNLSVRCWKGVLHVYVAPGFGSVRDFGGGAGVIRYRVDRQPLQEVAWEVGANGDAFFFPADARAFARELASADRLRVDLRDRGGRVHRAVFRLRGLELYLPRIESACPTNLHVD